MKRGPVSEAIHVLHQARQRNTAPTPQLVIDLGVNPDAGEVRISLIHFHAKGRRQSQHKGVRIAWLDKSQRLRVVPALELMKCIPRHGEKRSQIALDVTHDDLFRPAGYKHRSSYTRAVKASDIRHLRRFGQPSVYVPFFPEGDHRLAKGADGEPISQEYFVQPTTEELLRRKDAFSELAAVEWPSEKRYHWVPAWIFDPNFPGSPYQRLVFLALACHGLLSMKNGHIKGMIQGIAIARLARFTGLSEGAVRSALRFYSDREWTEQRHCPHCVARNGREFETRDQRDRRGRLIRFLKRADPQCPQCRGTGRVETACRGIGLIRLVIQPVLKDDQGKPVQECMKIVYPSGGDFDKRKAEQEIERFLRGTARWHAHPIWPLMAKVHRAVLGEFVGTQRRIETFQRECAERMKKAGIPPEAIQAAFYAHGPP